MRHFEEMQNVLLKTNQDQGCQIVYLQTKNLNLGKFWRALGRLENVNILCDHLDYFTDIWDIWCILCSFGTFFLFWYHVPRESLATLNSRADISKHRTKAKTEKLPFGSSRQVRRRKQEQKE
jgi:hypothetical protein